MPAVTKDWQLAFWHMPKTASTSAAEAIVTTRNGYKMAQQHDPACWRFSERGRARALNDIARHYGTIRDPWSWYGSLWGHAARNPSNVGWIPQYLTRYAGDPPTFERFMANALAMEGVDYTGWESVPGVIWSIRECPLPRVGGLWSWVVRYMYTDWLQHADAPPWCVDALLDAAQVNVALTRLGLRPPAEAMNTASGDGSLTSYANKYTTELIDRVVVADGELAAQLGYTKPFGPSEHAIILPPSAS